MRYALVFGSIFTARMRELGRRATHPSVVGIQPVFTSTDWRAVGAEL